MKKPTIKSVGYVPSPVPVNTTEIPRYLLEELSKISAALSLLAEGHLEMTYVQPEKPRDGDLRLADGDPSTWDPVPGSGRGVYVYHTGTWHKL